MYFSEGTYIDVRGKCMLELNVSENNIKLTWLRLIFNVYAPLKKDL